MPYKFKIGEKVRYARNRIPAGMRFPGWTSDYAGQDGHTLGDILTITNRDTSDGDHYYKKEPVGEHNYWIHEWQLERAKPTNEDRVKARLEKLNG